MSRWILAASAVVSLLAATAPHLALAQPLDADLLAAPGDGNAVLGVRTARLPGHLVWHAGLSLHWLNDSAVGDRSGETIRLLHDRVGADLSVGLGLVDWISLHAVIPVQLMQTTQSYPTPGTDTSDSGLGDLRFEARVRLLGSPERTQGLGLALSGQMSIPTASDVSLMGARGVTLTPQLLVDYRYRALTAALNIGWVVRPEVLIEDLVLDDALTVGLGMEIDLNAAELSLLTELALEAGFPSGIRSDAHTPVEALAGLRWRSGWGWMVTAATGVGLTSGFAAPDARVVVGVAFTNEPGSREAPAEDEPAPSAVLDPPLPTWPTRIPPDAFDAMKDPDPDGDGLVRTDRCPQVAEDHDGFQDSDGCPDDDNDRDGIPDRSDLCPNDKETPNGIQDQDGCPDQGTGRVAIGPDTLSLDDKIYFELGSAELQKRSLPLLREVASVLRSTPWIKRLQIEGHTDDQGDLEMNVDLSERRARTVMMFLIDAGVVAERLTARGFGPTRPAKRGDSKGARAANRRVELRLLEVDRPTQPGGGQR